MKKFKVTYQFYNDLGEWVETFLDNNGEGFTRNEAIEVADQLQVRGCRQIYLEIM